MVFVNQRLITLRPPRPRHLNNCFKARPFVDTERPTRKAFVSLRRRAERCNSILNLVDLLWGYPCGLAKLAARFGEG